MNFGNNSLIDEYINLNKKTKFSTFDSIKI